MELLIGGIVIIGFVAINSSINSIKNQLTFLALNVIAIKRQAKVSDDTISAIISDLPQSERLKIEKLIDEANILSSIYN